MLNTWEYKNYNSIWYQLLFAFRHPIEFIRTFKDEIYAWPSLPNTIHKYWMKLYTRLPFQKPCRWLGSMLIDRVYNSKLLDDFYCRTRGEITKYYTADCKFGRIKFYETVYTRNGKTINTFMDCFVTTLVDEEQGKKNVKKIKTTKRLIYSGWVFSHKKAENLFKEIVKKNPKIFKGEDSLYPETDDPFCVLLTDNMLSLLETGKFAVSWEQLNGNITLDKVFNNTKDTIIKLWAYVTFLLTCPNDFKAHYELARIENLCSWYMFVKARQKNPNIDNFYANLIKKGKIKEAKKYLSEIRKSDKNIKQEVTKDLKAKIKELKDKYLNMKLKYYRV